MGKMATCFVNAHRNVLLSRGTRLMDRVQVAVRLRELEIPERQAARYD